MCHMLFIHSFVNGHLGYFYLLTSVHKLLWIQVCRYLFGSLLSILLYILYTQNWDFWILWEVCVYVFEGSHPVFHSGCSCNVCLYFLTLLPTLIISYGFFFDMATLMSVKIALICISLRISEIEIFLCAHPFLKNINLPFRMNGGYMELSRYTHHYFKRNYENVQLSM